jgi:putative heme-binding domain-containing protein
MIGVPALAALLRRTRTLCGLSALLLSLFVLSTGTSVHADTAATAVRPSWTDSRLIGTPDPPPPLQVEPAFPKLSFDRPLDLAMAPGSDRWFVAEQGGRIYSFPNDPGNEQRDLVIDLREANSEISALYALTFHPQFVTNRLAYVCYITGSDQPDGTFVSEFRMLDTNPPTLDPDSERVLIRWWSGGHNGCCLKFGPDGYLYISTGDGGPADPPDILRAGQDVTNLLSAILRIDVDETSPDLPYRIPIDNPLIDIPEARPEIWAYGFRNPWRMSFDRETGDLWVGDVGWQLWEMIYRVEKGGNYGWAIMEGPQPVLPELKRGPTPILPPAVSHPHSEAASITGGFVYHGSQFPELQGAYIYGDFQTGKIWGLRYDGSEVTWHEELAQTPLQLVGFGEDHQGELYLVDYQRSQQIYRFARNTPTGGHENFPRRLSETGLFSDLASQVPSTGVISYEIQAHHWSDHTTSERWLGIPGTDPIRVAENGNWEFPDGAVVAKTVSIEMQRGSSATRRRLETQILHREEGSWRPYTYVWNEEQTDATLVESDGLYLPLTIEDTRAPGGVREQNYRVASRAECQLCHNPWVETKTTIFGVQTASLLGISTPQLNRPRLTSSLRGTGGPTATESTSSSAGSENQLTYLQQQGWITGSLPEAPSSSVAFTDPYDTTRDLRERVRSYLHVNCAHCHQLHAGGTATIELSFATKLDNAKMVDVRPAQGSFGISDARIISPGDPTGSVLYYRMAKTGSGRMPRIGSDEVDTDALVMLHDWIKQMTPRESSELNRPREETARLLEKLSQSGNTPLVEGPDGDSKVDELLGELVSTTRGALAVQRLLDSEVLKPELRQYVVARGAESSVAEVRDLFERFLPPSKRVKRLGNVVDPVELLALPADAERGREVFFREGSASCKSCHRVLGTGDVLGPDLSQIGKKYPPRDMLTHLLEPSKFMEPQYVPYVLETADGRVFSGLIAEQNDREVRLRTAQNEEVRIAAEDVDVLVPQQKSLMPELLLRDMTPQEAADLLAFLCSLKGP